LTNRKVIRSLPVTMHSFELLAGAIWLSTHHFISLPRQALWYVIAGFAITALICDICIG
jgi:hypothetical protein